MKTKLNYSDENYQQAVNCEHPFYNNPMTLEVASKLYILSTGTTDKVTVKVKNGIVYVLGVNTGLQYISLTIINPENDDLQHIYWDSNAIQNIKPNLLELSTNYQIRYLNQWV